MDQITRRNTVVVDTERFNLLQRAAKLIISGTHTVGQALNTLNKEWGYKTRPTRKLGGKEMSRPVFYRFLSDPYYYGLMVRKEGQIMGSHTTMFSKDEFELLQIRLGKKGKPHQTKHELPYKSMLKCGECGGAITAEEKWQIICPVCKRKFNKTPLTNACDRCNTKIEDMLKPKLLHYIYYHCTKKKCPDCTQGSMEIKKIEEKIDEELKKFEIPKEFTDWAIKYLNEVNTVAENTQIDTTKYLHKQYEDILKQIQNLINLKTRPDNADGSILSDDEFVEQKKKLLANKETTSEQIKTNDSSINKWVYLTEETFKFACYARYWFAKGDVKTKTYILSKLGNNMVIKDGNLLIDQSKAFFLIEKGYTSAKETALALEPNKEIITPIQMLSLEPVCKQWRKGRDSNSRETFASQGFRDLAVKPLRHLSPGAPAQSRTGIKRSAIFHSIH